MNNRGSIGMEVFIFLILVVLTSATVLYLVQLGILNVKAENENVQVLDAEFIPMGREGYLSVKEFTFCEEVDVRYNCLHEKNRFKIGEPVHFKFVVESTAINGQIQVVENYRLKSPTGELLLDINDKGNFHFDAASNKKTEIIAFTDFFVINPGSASGKYTLELVLENPLLGKTTTTIQPVVIGE